MAFQGVPRARLRLLVVLMMALSAGSVLALGTYNYLQHVPVKVVSVPTRPVVVAATDLKLGTELSAGDLKVVQWPEDAVPADAIPDPLEAIGRGVLSPMVRNEPVFEAKLAPRGSGAGLPPVIPLGMRAVSVRVNEVIGVAGYVLPGTHVDVLVTLSPTDQRNDTVTKLVLANVQVLTAGTNLETPQSNRQPQQVTVVTLLVSPDQAERLTMASTQGLIQLALRNPLDEVTPETLGVRPGELIGLGARRSAAEKEPAARPSRTQRPKPPDPAPPVNTVEIIRGGQRTREVVK